MTILATCGDVADSLDVDGVRRAEDAIAQTTDNRLVHVEEGHDVEELLDLQGGDVFLHLDDACHLCREQVIAAPLAATITPLRQTYNRIGVTGRSWAEAGVPGIGARPRAGVRRSLSPGDE